MYSLVAWMRNPFFFDGWPQKKVIAQWYKIPISESVQEVVDSFNADRIYWVGRYVGRMPPVTASAAIWFKIEWSNGLA